MAETLKNYYEILGVPRSANTDQIRTAYRKLLLKFHPDKNVGDVYFEEWSKKINEAFEVLMNPQVRLEYDQVYNETQAAWKQANLAAKNETTDPDSPVSEPHTDIDKNIQKLSHVYISYKEDYHKAQRHLDALKNELHQKKLNPMPHYILGAFLLLSVLAWVGFDYKSKTALEQPQHIEAEMKTVEPPPAVSVSGGGSVNVDLSLKVIVEKAFFFKTPDGAILQEKFLSKGNKVFATKQQDGYYYCTFRSTINTSYIIEGWIKKSDVEIVAQ